MIELLFFTALYAFAAAGIALVVICMLSLLFLNHVISVRPKVVLEYYAAAFFGQLVFRFFFWLAQT